MLVVALLDAGSKRDIEPNCQPAIEKSETETCAQTKENKMLSDKEEKEKLESEEKVKIEAEAVESKDKAEFDKVQQRADQEAANAKKARDQLSESQETIEAARTENESLKEKLAEATSKAADAGIENVELDVSKYEGTDIAIVQSIKSLKDDIKAKDQRIAGLEKKAVAGEEQSRIDKSIQARNTAYEEILSDLDSEYGADCRNEAVKKFQELIDEGKIPKGNTAKATRELEKCYKAAQKAKSTDSKDKTSLSLDSGSGGGNAPNLAGSEIKEGSLDEVHAQYAAAAKK